jgi:feruloyl-CoA synthase
MIQLAEPRAPGVLVFPSITGCRQLVGDAAASMDDHMLIQHPAVIAAIRSGLKEHAARQRGSSTRIERFSILSIPPSREAGERTDKGSINQLAVLTARADDVEALYLNGRLVCAVDE